MSEFISEVRQNAILLICTGGVIAGVFLLVCGFIEVFILGIGE